MYVIFVYDIEQKWVAKICKFLRRYLTGVQNSVFEGEITDAKFKELKTGLEKIFKKDKDSILFYRLKAEKFLNKEIMGLDKNPTDSFI
jgi:CRISPR-associated protein Cas2